MKNVTLENYTNSEIEWLAEMVAEKLNEMGYGDIGSYAFSIEVEFEETEKTE